MKTSGAGIHELVFILCKLGRLRVCEYWRPVKFFPICLPIKVCWRIIILAATRGQIARELDESMALTPLFSLLHQ